MNSTARRIAVFDVGKTNAKLVVLDCATGAEVAAARILNRVVDASPYPHYDIDALWRFLLDALTRFSAMPGFDAISITTHGASAALLDGEGQLVLPVLDYEYAYPEDVVRAYAALRPDFAETFSPPQPAGLNLGAQLHYQKSVFPEEFRRVRRIVTYPQYWSGRLTGVFSCEATSLGCHTDLWNPRLGTYSSLVDRLGIGGVMAPLRSAFDALGPVTPALSKAIGLAVDVPVYCGIHDSNASLLPHLLRREPPFRVVSTGTWVVGFGVGGDLDRLDPARDTLANVDAYGRAVPSARFMGGREFELLSDTIGPVTEEETDRALAGVLDKGIRLLPNIVPGSGPFPRRSAAWQAAAEASPAERRAAAILYLALMTEAGLSLIGAGGPILVEGPFARNRLYLAALADFAKAEVLALSGSTGTAQGAALLAGAALPPPQPLPGVAPLETGRYRDDWYRALEDAV